MTLDTSVYTAHRGYAWSSVPAGLSAARLNQLYRFISCARGDFPDPLSVEVGLVSDGETIGAFTIQNVEKWDSEKRASDYVAFAFFSPGQASEIDFIDLINHDFFWTPTQTPQTSLEYEGRPSAPEPPDAGQLLRKSHAYLLRDPHAVGAVLARFARNSSRWICMMGAENILRIDCNSWT